MGLMQRLFHIYTVDAHTLQLIRNITRFYTGTVENDYPVVTQLAQRLPKINYFISRPYSMTLQKDGVAVTQNSAP